MYNIEKYHDIKEQYDSLFIEKALLLQKKSEKKRKLKKIKKKIKVCSEAHWLLVETSKEIQKQFKQNVEVLITHAIQTIYKYPYIFKLNFEMKRNNLEVTPIVKKGKTSLQPKEDMGGGILDVIAMALKIILWHLEEPRTRAVLFLDEPFRFLGSLANKAGYMLKYLSRYFGLQIIMTTHDKKLSKFYDRKFKVTYNGIESTVTRQIGRRKVA